MPCVLMTWNSFRMYDQIHSGLVLQVIDGTTVSLTLINICDSNLTRHLIEVYAFLSFLA